MGDPLIPGGYILLSRKIIESEIWSKPPLYIKIWIYLLSKAQHKQYKQLSRGQLRISIPEIIEECSWYVGYRKVKPTKDQVFQVINWLRKGCEGVDEGDARATMITTTKATQGLLLEIVNYNIYQDSKNYESNKVSNGEEVTKATREQRQPDNINKNDKNDKNVKEVYKDIVEYLNSKTNKKYKDTSKKTQSLIDARLKDNFILDDFKKVIDNKCISWKGNNEMDKFLRPETLFGNKFESYLNESVLPVKETISSNNWRGSDKRL